MKQRKTDLTRWLLLASLLMTFAFPCFSDNAAKPKTVLDFFLLVPYRYIASDEYTELGKSVARSHRELLLNSRRWGSIIDLRHDYIYQVIDSSPTQSVALFRYKGRVLIAVSYEIYDVQPTEYAFYLLRYENGACQDVTKQMLPVAPNEFHNDILPRYGTTINNYVLPRYGTTIQVKNAKGKTLYKLQWEAGKFVRERTTY